MFGSVKEELWVLSLVTCHAGCLGLTCRMYVCVSFSGFFFFFFYTSDNAGVSGSYSYCSWYLNIPCGVIQLTCLLVW